MDDQQKFRELGDNAWEQLRFWCLEDSNWKDAFEKEQVKMSRNDIPATEWHSKGKMFKGVGIINNASIDELISLVTDMPKRPMWDPQNEFYNILTVLHSDQESSIDIVHTGVKGMFAVSARDFVSVRKTVYRDGIWISAQVHCEYDAPSEHKKRYIRGSLLPSGWVFEKIDDQTTKVHYVAGVHLGGWLPQSAVDHAIEQNTYKFFPMVRSIFQKKEDK